MKKHLLVFVLIILGVSFLYTQEAGNVEGYVFDENNSPLVGVNITVKGEDMGSATNEDGYYRIEDIPIGSVTLKASYIGYHQAKKKITIEEDETYKVNFTLKTAALEGKQVVVVGYGTEKRRDITGSVSTLEGKSMEKIEMSSTLNAMQGKISGVDIEQTSGLPGTSPRIRVRGINTMNNTSPLVVVDGVPGDITSVTPEQIKSINVLKDASAAAIYGSRAANGVVLIETKTGENKPNDE